MKQGINKRLGFITALIWSSTLLLVVGATQPLAEQSLRPIMLGAALVCALAGTVGLFLRKQLNALVSTLEEQSQAQKMWMAEASHEIRTPIAVLRAQVEALQDGVHEVNTRTLAVLHGEIMALSKLSDNLSSLTRADVGQLVKSEAQTDVATILTQTVDAFAERFAEKNIQVQLDKPNPVRCLVKADSNRLKQVFFNLLENSLRYTNAGGKVRIGYQLVDKDDIVLSFDDSEPGLSPEFLPKIFERFFRGELSRSRSMGGSGLGLAICKDIIEAHAGSITAMPSNLGGLRIEIRLPLSRENSRV